MEPILIATATAAFLFAGCVKGVIGLGLPLTAISVLTTVIGIREAMPLIIVPVMVSNLWQVLQGGAPGALFRRFWSLNLMLAAGVWGGTVLLFVIDQGLVAAGLGVVVILYSLINIFAIHIRLPAGREGLLSPVVGFLSGVLTGLTGSIGVPVAIYFQALALARETFLQAISLSFFLTSFFWAGALIDQGALNPRTAAIGAAALIPALAGMWFGQKIRLHLSQEVFSKGVFVFLIIVGANLIRKGVV